MQVLYMDIEERTESFDLQLTLGIKTSSHAMNWCISPQLCISPIFSGPFRWSW